MPFKSKAQRRKFAELMVKGEISPETFEEWNRYTGAAKLPERVSDKKPKKSAARKKTAARKATRKRTSAKNAKTAPARKRTTARKAARKTSRKSGRKAPRATRK